MPTITTPDGLTLFYKVDGTDDATPPIIFLNGMTQTTRHWASHVRKLREHRMVITYDARGQGDSDPPRRPPTLSTHVEDLLLLLDILQIQQADLVGFSHGARVALGFATDHPERLRRLILTSATAEPTALSRTIVRSWLEVLKAGGLPALSWTSLTHILGPAFLEQNERLLSNIVRASVERNSVEGVHLLLEGLANFPPLDDLAGKISAPTLVISSDQDPLVTINGARKLALLCQGTHKLIKDCGHTIPIERPQLFRQLVTDFLA